MATPLPTHITTCPDFKTDHLRWHERVIAEAVLRALPAEATGGGCQAFWSPDKWKQRGEHYGTNSLLILVHDGGDLAPLCNPDYGMPLCMRALEAELREMGLFVESCTCWYSAVYLA
jgi:hypothetical protein